MTSGGLCTYLPVSSQHYGDRICDFLYFGVNFSPDNVPLSLEKKKEFQSNNGLFCVFFCLIGQFCDSVIAEVMGSDTRQKRKAHCSGRNDWKATLSLIRTEGVMSKVDIDAKLLRDDVYLFNILRSCK